MGKKGQQKHLKRFTMPKVMRLPRKAEVWAVKPKSGPHSGKAAMALREVIRDTLHLAGTAKEADKILSEGRVLVDGRVRTNPKFPIGFMDVVSIPETGKHYRVLYDSLHRLILNEIPESEANFKLCRVSGKSIVKGNKIQLEFHDGKTCVGEFKDFRLSDVAKISLPDFKVMDRIPFGEGAEAIVIGGANVSKLGKIEGVEPMKGRRPDLINMKDGDDSFKAPKNYVFVVGSDKPLISISGGNSE